MNPLYGKPMVQEPFWLRRAKGQTNSPVVNQMWHPDKDTGQMQTVYSATHPMGLLPNAKQPYQSKAMLYPTIRWRSPGLEKLPNDRALQEAMEMKDYMVFPNLWDATEYSKSLSASIEREVSLNDQILGKVSERLGINASRLNDFANVVSGVESSYGKNLRNPESSAKGIYQLTDDTFVTAKNRLKNITGSIPERIKNAESILDLSPDDQKALFFAHLTEDKGSDAEIRSYLEGGSGRDLYVKHHYKGDPDLNTNKRLDDFFG